MKYLTKKNIIIFILLVATYFSLFFQLDSYALQLWDEGTYAVNAYEMCLDGDLLVKHFNGGPEMWATNPPLVCYFQAICIKIFGPNELAVRLPSALAALGIILLIIRFSIKENLGLDFTTYAVLALLSSQGYVTYHVTRTADLDSVLIFFIIGSIIYFYKFIEYPEQKIKYLVLFSVFILLGYYAKGIACFMILPAFLVYAIVKNKVLYVLKTKQLYYCMFSVIFIILIYYYLREQRNPGYVKTMFNSEFGRYTTIGNELHQLPFLFYIKDMFEREYKYFFPFIIGIIILFMFLPKNNLYKNKSTIWLICIVIFLLVISLSSTKTNWYKAPLYPMLSIYFALGLKSIINYKTYSKTTTYVAKGTLCVGLFAFPYSSIIEDNIKGPLIWHDTQFGDALRLYNSLKNKPLELEMLLTGYNAPAIFYKTVYEKKFNYKITIGSAIEKITMLPGKVY